MPCGLFYLFPHVIVAVEVEDICDEVEGILVVLDLGVESREIEAVGEVFLVYFAEVLIAPGGYELGDMSVMFRRRRRKRSRPGVSGPKCVGL